MILLLHSFILTFCRIRQRGDQARLASNSHIFTLDDLYSCDSGNDIILRGFRQRPLLRIACLNLRPSNGATVVNDISWPHLRSLESTYRSILVLIHPNKKLSRLRISVWIKQLSSRFDCHVISRIVVSLSTSFNMMQKGVRYVSRSCLPDRDCLSQ